MDARIALGLNPVVLPDPAEPMHKALAIQALMGQRDMQGLQLQQGQHAFQKQLATEELLKGATSDDDVIRRLMTIDPSTALKLQAEKWKSRKDQMDAGKSSLEQGSQMAAAFLAVPDEQKPAVYPQFVQQWNQLGLKTVENERWNPAFLPGLQHIAAQGLSPKDSAERLGAAGASDAALKGMGIGQPQPQAQPITQNPAINALQEPNDFSNGPIIRKLGAPPMDGGGIPSPVAPMPPVPAVQALSGNDDVAKLSQDRAAAMPIVQGMANNVSSFLANDGSVPQQAVQVSATPPNMTVAQLRQAAQAALATRTPEGRQMFEKLMDAAREYDARLQKDQELEQMRSHQTEEEKLRRMQINQEAERVKQGWVTIDPFGTLRSAATNFAMKPQAPGQPGVAQSIGEDFLASVPGPLATQVKALAEGRMAFPAGMALKSPYWQNMLQLVSQYDPSFDAVNFNARAATRKDFTSGTAAKSATALNTVIGHLDMLSQAADALKNTSFPAYNSITNWMANNVGDPRVKEFDNTRKAVVDELTRVWRGTGGSEGDIKTWSDTIGAANSPAQLHGVINNLGNLLESRINALNDQYAKGMGTTEQPLQLLSDKSRALLDKLEQRAQGGLSSPKSSAGNAPMYAINPNNPGSRIMSIDGGKTWQPAK